MADKRDPEMHQTKKSNQWYHRSEEGFAYSMKFHPGVDKHSGLIHSVVVTAANVHELSPAAELLHGDEEVVYGDAARQTPGLPDTPEGRQKDLIKTAKPSSVPRINIHSG
jgi:IS5 family transposase